MTPSAFSTLVDSLCAYSDLGVLVLWVRSISLALDRVICTTLGDADQRTQVEVVGHARETASTITMTIMMVTVTIMTLGQIEYDSVRGLVSRSALGFRMFWGDLLLPFFVDRRGGT